MGLAERIEARKAFLKALKEAPRAKFEVEVGEEGKAGQSVKRIGQKPKGRKRL